MRAPTPPLKLSPSERDILEAMARSTSAAHREVQTAKALIMANDGLANTAIAARLEVSPATVVNWRDRFVEDGLAGIGRVRPGRGRKRVITDAQVEEVIRKTTTETPPGQTHWSTRSMAAAAGLSSASVQRIWTGVGLKPHLVDTFRVSGDPAFDDKLIDVVGLYLHPPANAIVLAMDEKSQIEALDPTQPSLPMTKGRAGGTMTHDYKRNGTTTLVAALDVATGAVIGRCLPEHRHTEFIEFLRVIDREVPDHLAVHLILDNYATHKHPAVTAWLAKHPRFAFHFTPTSSSWLNLVERWFRDLTVKAIRRGGFPSVPDLIAAIQACLDANNADPRPLVWTATAESILAKVRRETPTRRNYPPMINQTTSFEPWARLQPDATHEQFALRHNAPKSLVRMNVSPLNEIDAMIQDLHEKLRLKTVGR